jgi:hypothetical protein
MVLFAKYNWSFQIEEDEFGGACSANGEEGRNMNVIGR